MFLLYLMFVITKANIFKATVIFLFYFIFDIITILYFINLTYLYLYATV